MTTFCPNCGKPNADQAIKCVSCGTELKRPGGPAKFKGTMMMGGVAGPAPGAGIAPAAAAPPAPAPTPVAATPAAAPPKQNMAFQATMLGQMPPAGGFGTPVGGGFGAPPSAPANGGFGAPPSAPANGGFGAPPAAGDGFGAPPSGQAGDGFGAPAAGGFPPSPAAPPSAAGDGLGSPAAGGGFGSPAAGGGFGSPAAGGGFGGGVPGLPGGPGEKKKKTWLWVGLGCLGLLVIVCPIGGYLACKKLKDKGQELVAEGGGQLGAQISRVPLALALTQIRGSCASDPSGAGTAQFFSPQIFAQAQGLICPSFGDATINAFSGSGGNATVEVLGSTDEAAVATASGMDGNRCYRYTAGPARLYGCMPSSGSYTLIGFQNLPSAAGGMEGPSAPTGK